MCVCKAKIILTIILLPILLLSGCIPKNGPLNENAETIVPILTVHSGGASIKTDAHFSSALTFSTYGWPRTAHLPTLYYQKLQLNYPKSLWTKILSLSTKKTALSIL